MCRNRKDNLMRINNVQNNQQYTSFKAQLVKGTPNEAQKLAGVLTELVEKQLYDFPIVSETQLLGKGFYAVATDPSEVRRIKHTHGFLYTEELCGAMSHGRAQRSFIKDTRGIIDYSRQPTPIAQLLKDAGKPEFNASLPK